MALTSPRFSSSKQLVEAEAGQALREGRSGRAVHLVQMALMDLGYAMPRSTKNPNYSPDGIFGSETKQKLIDFQNANKLPPTGAIDRDTIRTLDGLFQKYTHRVRLHFRSLADTNVPFARHLADTEIVYGQYGIKIEFASGMSFKLTPDEEVMFDKIDDSCEWEITGGEYLQLQQLGTPVPETDIAVYYVRELADAGGCGGHVPNHPACTVAANTTRWATAHEVGHVLLTSRFIPAHSPERRNLMMPDVLYFTATPVLADRQVAQILRSPLCFRMP
jgi:peptidoglycan hydrolase-like protein with peptidoglycan-binding domain